MNHKTSFICKFSLCVYFFSSINIIATNAAPVVANAAPVVANAAPVVAPVSTISGQVAGMFVDFMTNGAYCIGVSITENPKATAMLATVAIASVYILYLIWHSKMASDMGKIKSQIDQSRDSVITGINRLYESHNTLIKEFNSSSLSNKNQLEAIKQQLSVTNNQLNAIEKQLNGTNQESDFIKQELKVIKEQNAQQFGKLNKETCDIKSLFATQPPAFSMDHVQSTFIRSTKMLSMLPESFEVLS